MSYGLTANDWMDAPAELEPLPAGTGTSPAGLIVLPADAPAQVYRSPLIPLAFAVPVVVSALSYAGGGIPLLSDVAFLILTALCFTLLMAELMAFGRRQGIGAILIYGGVLVWFCHDYGSNWFLHNFNDYNPFFLAVTKETVGRALFYHCLFIDLMVIAFRFPVLRFIDRLVVGVPEPSNSRFYVWLVVVMLAFGWAGFIPTADLLPVTLAKACLWFVPGVGLPQFTIFRSGNLNFNWAAYDAQILQAGQVGGILASYYALLVARSTLGRIFGWLDWAFWMSYSFTSYRRGDIAFMALPVLGVMFLKYHAQRDPARRAQNFRRLIATFAVTALIWVGVQKQSSDRNLDSSIKLFRAAGNTMFSEGLNTWVLIPATRGYPYNENGVDGVLRPIPDTLWWFVTGPIPRALWTTKPVEEFALWYSSYISHDQREVNTGGLYGTTVATGAVGYWYFRYGPPGVIEGGLLFGFLMGVAERALRRAQGQPMKVLFALQFATFLFRSYRDLWWHNLDAVLIGGLVLTVVIRAFYGRPSQSQSLELVTA